MKDYIKILQENNLLKVIDTPCSTELEIAHLSYLEVKKPDSKALLFTNPVDKNGKKYEMPVLTNLFGSQRALELIMGAKPDEIAARIEKLLKPKKPENFSQKLEFLSQLIRLKSVLPKRLKSRGECQQVVKSKINLYELPILRTWEGDAAPFITMGQVYTKSLDGKAHNVGMYRLQVHGPDELGMHWQIHKDGAHFFHEYAKAGKQMPVSVAIGGDPLYIWCAQAPLPKDVFELLLYGFIREKNARLVKSITNDIYIPNDADVVIEGFVDTTQSRIEGPFGDHTGFYTPAEPFAVMKVSKITQKKNPIFYATVVGKPPLEDKYFGGATERIFLPLLKTSVPDLIDYKMPENGVFHNLILAKFAAAYPAHAQQIAHAFWGVGQMSFVKHAIFVGSDAPALDDYSAFCEYVLSRISPASLLITSGICDQLDHASPNACFGGKLGVDASVDKSTPAPTLLSDDELLIKFQKISPEILALRQIFTQTKNPITMIKTLKTAPLKELFNKLLVFKEHFKILVFMGSDARLENHYMNVWRVTNNIDAQRDIFISGEQIGIDATAKNALDGYHRQWPQMTNCTRSVIDGLIKKGLLDSNSEFFEKFEIFG